MYTALMIFSALLLVFLNALFVAAEFSFVKVRKTQLEILAFEGDKRAVSALFGVHHLDAYLSVCQLGITLASLGLGWLGEPAVARLLEPVFGYFFVTSPQVQVTISVACGFAIITFLHVIFGELVPKSISIQLAEATVLRLARPMRFFYILCFPLVAVLNSISNLVLRLIGVQSVAEGELSHSPEELRMLIFDSSKRGSLDKEEGRLLDNIFSFYQKSAKDIMIYRTDAISLDVESTRLQTLEKAQECGHTRFPVYAENSDNIIGFVHVKDVVHRKECVTLRPLVREPIYAPETIHLYQLLRLMQEKRTHFSVVIDEYGIWQGIITLEDLVEAIVGDIQDEFDNEEPDFVDEGDGVFSIASNLSLDDLAEHMPLESQGSGVDPYKILAAHFVEILERIPQVGDYIDLCGKRFTVTAMERNRIRRLRVEDVPSGDSEGS